MTRATPNVVKSDAGFSLVELLIVIFIIGLLSSVAIMTLPEGRTPAVRTSDNIATILTRLSRESILLGEPVRWRHTQNGELYERYTLGSWTPMNSGGIYERWSPDSLVQMDIELLDYAGKDSNENKSLNTKIAGEKYNPAIVFLPTGEATAARILVSDSAHQIELKLESDGTLVRSDNAN